MSMEATFLAFGCPVQVEAEQYIHLCFHDTNIFTPICTYFHSSGILGRLVISQDVVAVLCLWPADIGFLWLGLHPHKIGSHSLRSNGSMTLHQNSISDSTIKAIG